MLMKFNITSKIYFILLLALFILGINIGMASAIDQQDIVGYGTQKQNIDIKFPCRAGGNICDTTYSCNATIYSANGNRVINNSATTRNSADYNITLINNYTNEFGFYRIESTCSNNIYNGSTTYFIEITADGKPSKAFPFVYSLIILALIFLILNKYVKELFKLNIFRVFAGILFLVIGVITFYPGFNYINWTNLEGLTFGTIFLGLGMLIITKEMDEYL